MTQNSHRRLIYLLVILIISLSVCGHSSENNSKQDHSIVLHQIQQIFGENNITISFVHDPGKCGLSMMFEIIKNWNNFSQKQKDQMSLLLASPTMQKSRIIGNFQIHYDTTGSNEPALLDNNFQRIPNTAEAYIDSVGKIFNEVWVYLIDTLGYFQPPFEYGQSYYNIFIQDFGSLLYGQTIFKDQIGSYIPPRYTSYIEIDNDFNIHYSRGMAGLKVTAAHEFHHAIQIGQYGWRYNDYYFYEVTSTWMEDVVYTDVNDYYAYIKFPNGMPKGHFASPAAAFTYVGSNIEYSRAIWGKFIEKHYSKDVMRDAWEFMRSMQSVPALDSALKITGSSFKEAFLDWTVWNYNTGLHADTINYYSEGIFYPPIQQQDTVQYTSPSTSFSKQTQAISSIYYPVKIVDNTMRVIISNLDLLNPYSRSFYDFTYEIRDTGDQTFKYLSNGLYVRLNVSTPSNWVSQELIDNVNNIQDIGVSPRFILAQNYPNPFNPTTTIRYEIPNPDFVILKIYNVLGQEVITLVNEMKQAGSYIVDWDGGSVPSGIYFYRLQAGSFTETRKLVVIK
ncbi:MAG: T9SS type A sorting domain-containing protein [Bacteroidota bacterium]|nr:T9SS type A sorting domain-containing protein [Bacteroidota bacterium]